MTFAFKPFDEMTPDDYANLGLRCGLEIHQQLLTRRKLFCHCPAGRYRQEYDAEVLRHMRPTLSELGEVDPTALMEKKTRKNIYYRLHQETVCTYEFDDASPFFPDEQAIDISLEIVLLLHLHLVGELHIARKQYLDGSIPAGFQRTALLGVEGWIPYRDRRIAITHASLEEDSCREVSDVGHDRVWLTDRLGMPLLEMVTAPELHTPQEAAEAAQLLRLLTRSTGKVRTGPGAARQDVNVSIRGGTRVEIKGVAQIKRIPLLVYNEARRQCALLSIRDQLAARGLRDGNVDWSAHDVTRTVTKTSYPPIQAALARGHQVRAVVLRGFAGLLNHPTQEQTTFGKEFSDRVRVIACQTERPNLLHSDAGSEFLSVRQWKELRRRTETHDQDALVLVWGEPADVILAGQEIAIRAQEATLGVPSDTRQALADGTTGFERVLPGPERMYPDTDLPPIVVEDERVDRIRRTLPLPIWERRDRLAKLGLAPAAIDRLCLSARAGIFERVVGELGIDPVFAASILVERFRAWSRRGLRPEALTDDELYAVFQGHRDFTISREGVRQALFGALLRRTGAGAAHSPVVAGPSGCASVPRDDADCARLIDGVMRSSGARRFATRAARQRFLMGQLMPFMNGGVDGRRLSELLQARLGLVPADSARERTAP